MILILGGTSDALALASRLYEITNHIVFSTATLYGYEVSNERFKGKIINGSKDLEELKIYIQKNHIQIIVDSTHPYAVNVSKNAIDACKACNISYIRYERPEAKIQEENLIHCDTYEEAGRIAEGICGNIFITTGSNHLDKILPQIRNIDRVKVRVLPQSKVLVNLETLGLNANHIIAAKGPFTEEMNYLMFKEANAKVMICKESGEVGGTLQKLNAAKRLNMKTIMMHRPKIDYPNRYSDFVSVEKYIRERIEYER